ALAVIPVGAHPQGRDAGHIATVVEAGAHLVGPEPQGLTGGDGQGQLRLDPAEAGVCLAIEQAGQGLVELTGIVVEIRKVRGAGGGPRQAVGLAVVAEAAAVVRAVDEIGEAAVVEADAGLEGFATQGPVELGVPGAFGIEVGVAHLVAAGGHVLAGGEQFLRHRRPLAAGQDQPQALAVGEGVEQAGAGVDTVVVDGVEAGGCDPLAVVAQAQFQVGGADGEILDEVDAEAPGVRGRYEGFQPFGGEVPVGVVQPEGTGPAGQGGVGDFPPRLVAGDVEAGTDFPLVPGDLQLPVPVVGAAQVDADLLDESLQATCQQFALVDGLRQVDAGEELVAVILLDTLVVVVLVVPL